MATSPLTQVVHDLRRAVLHDGAGLSDTQLLGLFIDQRDDAAFAGLVNRHGPLVWGVCRRILTNHQDAEDAFQATFLVLARKAVSIKPRAMVANWLHGVACRTALKVRTVAGKRRRRERQVTMMPEPQCHPQDSWSDLEPIIDQELARLPDKCRIAILLCDLEGMTGKDAAHQLRIPEKTLASRLRTGRMKLARALTRHGVTLPAAALAVVLSQKAVSANAPVAVITSTVKSAAIATTGQAVAAKLISAKVAALIQGVMKAMLLTKLKNVACVILAVMLLGGLTTWVGTSFADRGGSDEESKTKTQAARSEKEVGPAPVKEEKQAVEQVVDLGSKNLRVTEAKQTDRQPGLFVVNKVDEKENLGVVGYFRQASEKKIPPGWEYLIGLTPGPLLTLGSLQRGDHLDVVSFRRQGNRITAQVKCTCLLKERSETEEGISIYLDADLPKLPPGDYEVEIRFKEFTREGDEVKPRDPTLNQRLEPLKCTFEVPGAKNKAAPGEQKRSSRLTLKDLVGTWEGTRDGITVSLTLDGPKVAVTMSRVEPATTFTSSSDRGASEDLKSGKILLAVAAEKGRRTEVVGGLERTDDGSLRLSTTLLTQSITGIDDGGIVYGGPEVVHDDWRVVKDFKLTRKEADKERRAPAGHGEPENPSSKAVPKASTESGESVVKHDDTKKVEPPEKQMAQLLAATKVRLSIKNEPIHDALDALAKQSGSRVWPAVA